MASPSNNNKLWATAKYFTITKTDSNNENIKKRDWVK